MRTILGSRIVRKESFAIVVNIAKKKMIHIFARTNIQNYSVKTLHHSRRADALKERTTMRPLHDLNTMAFNFEYLIQADVDNLKSYRKKIATEKDATQMKNILKAICNLEDDVARYKEWAEREVETSKRI